MFDIEEVKEILSMEARFCSSLVKLSKSEDKSELNKRKML